VRPAGDPAVVVAGLVSDFKQLRKGEGVLAANVGVKTGPWLRALCGIDDGAAAAAVRGRLRSVLVPLAARLSVDYRDSFLAALALGPGDDRARFFDERMDRLAATFRRSNRTTRRRVDMSFVLFAQLVVK
jgi:hypothetical protein